MKYCQNPDADVPVLYLDQQIGQDPDRPMDKFIDGSDFASEIYQLAALGKKSCKIIIASPGGLVVEAQKIYNAILDAPIKVDTHCVFAASMAVPIWLAGRKHTIADFAQIMFHPVSGGDPKSELALGDSVATMINARANIGMDLVKGMMKRTTWMSTAEAVECGLIGQSDIISSSSMNLPRKLTATEPMAMWTEAKNLYNNILKNTEEMKELNKLLGLADDATETDRVNAINALKNAKSYVNEGPEAITNLVQAAVGKALTPVTDKVTALETEKEALKAKLEAQEGAAKRAAAEGIVNKYIDRLGGAAVTPDVKNQWIDNATAKPVETEAQLAALPLKAVNMEKVMAINALKAGEVPTTAAGFMGKTLAGLKNQGYQVPAGI